MRRTACFLLLIVTTGSWAAETSPPTLASGTYDFEFTLGNTKQLESACTLAVGDDGSLTLTAGKRDPLVGTVSGNTVTFSIDNDANRMALSGSLAADDYITGQLTYSVGPETVTGTFRIYPSGRDPLRSPPQTGSQPSRTRMPIYVTPYYNSEGPVIEAGDLSDELIALSADNSNETIDRIEARQERLPIHVLFILAIRLYDVGAKDEAVKWFYIAQLRHRYLYTMIDPERIGGLGSQSFELKHAHNAFMQLAGEYINGYAFGDPDRLLATLRDVKADHAQVPDFTSIYPAMADIISGDPEQARAGVIEGLDRLIAYIDEHREDILRQRKENGIEGRY